MLADKEGGHLRKTAAILTLLGAAGLLIVLMSVRETPLRALDFEHYIDASRLIWRGADPYAGVEYFSPPWFAILLGPLTLLAPSLSASIWLLLSVLSIAMIPLVAARWLAFPKTATAQRMALLLSCITPSATYVYVTGQSSGLVGFSLVLVAYLLTTSEKKSSGVLLALGLLGVSLKPHVVALPLIIVCCELVRRRMWRHLAYTAVLFLSLAGVSFLLYPGWPRSLLHGLATGAYLGGEGFVAQGYYGLLDLGVPWILLLPLGGYAFYLWLRDGVNAFTLAWSICTGLLIVPYWRPYDGILLLFPTFVWLHQIGRSPRRWLGIILAVMVLFVLPMTDFSQLAPALLAIALLLGQSLE